MKENLLSKNQFAFLCGIDRTQLYRYLKKETIPTMATAQKIVKATNGEITIEDIYGINS